MKILIIGSGNIALEYVKALKKLKYINISVFSRTLKNAKKFQKEHNLVSAYGGNIDLFMKYASDFEAFIIATPTEKHLEYLSILVSFENKKILVEKPVSNYSKKLKSFINYRKSSNIFVAFNRLYYPSVNKIKLDLLKDPPTSAFFSFTEWIDKINFQKFDDETLHKWGVANSLHVISTVFDLIGFPKDMKTFKSGSKKISWHPSSSIYCGSGITDRSVLFSYHSDWLSAGRWYISICNPKGTYHLRPMEGLLFQPKNSIKEEIIIPVHDGQEKCGFVEMLDDWLKNKKPRISLIDALKHIEFIEKMMY